MRVLKKGRKQTGWSTTCHCTGDGNGMGGCGAKLLVEYSDLFETSNTDMKGETDYFVTFKCPECGVLTDLSDTPPGHRELPTQKRWEASARSIRDR